MTRVDQVVALRCIAFSGSSCGRLNPLGGTRSGHRSTQNGLVRRSINLPVSVLDENAVFYPGCLLASPSKYSFIVVTTGRMRFALISIGVLNTYWKESMTFFSRWSKKN